MALDRTPVKSVTKSGDEYCRVCGEFVIKFTVAVLVYTVKLKDRRLGRLN